MKIKILLFSLGILNGFLFSYFYISAHAQESLETPFESSSPQIELESSTSLQTLIKHNKDKNPYFEGTESEQTNFTYLSGKLESMQKQLNRIEQNSAICATK